MAVRILKTARFSFLKARRFSVSDLPPKLTSPKEVAAYLKANGMSPLKKFGQNFLCDSNILRKIAEAACPPGACVLEIGMGLGALTHALAQRASRLVTVEIDRGLIRAQKEDIGLPENAVIVEGDILDTDLTALAREYFHDVPFYICGNLPYYITGPIILRILEAPLPVTAVTAMVQKEVADRLSASPGDTDYSAFTALVRYYGSPRLLFTVSAGCFYPAPDVDSAVIQIGLGSPHPAVPFAAYREIVNSAFSMRRKTLSNNLKARFGAQTPEILAACGIPGGIRPQQVTPEQFLCIAGKSETQ